MSKFNKGFITGIISILFGVFMTLLFFSCQPKDDLKGLNRPCKVISTEMTYRGHEVKYIDKDGKQRTVISEALYEQYKKNLKK